jgi:hypothetical protein
MHKHCRRSIQNLGFSHLRKSKFTKQCLKKGHCQVKPIKVRPLIFTMKKGDLVLEEHQKKCSLHVLPLPLAKATALSHQTYATQEEPV